MNRRTHGQIAYPIRFEWGLRGIEALAPHTDLCIIVDVLSFTTSVDIATGRGAVVYPYRGRGEAAQEFATRQGALLAGDTNHAFTLRPASLLEIEAETRLVLPSPNGSTLTLAAAEHGPVLAGSLRNAAAVAAYAQTIGHSVAVIASGERWSYEPNTDSLRPSLEDLLGAGAILEDLKGPRSPEAEAAVAVFLHFRDKLLPALQTCASGQELSEKGFAVDVALAAQLNVSMAVPRLIDEGYRALL